MLLLTILLCRTDSVDGMRAQAFECDATRLVRWLRQAMVRAFGNGIFLTTFRQSTRSGAERSSSFASLIMRGMHGTLRARKWKIDTVEERSCAPLSLVALMPVRAGGFLVRRCQ